MRKFRWQPIVLGCAVPLLWSVVVPAFGATDPPAVLIPPDYNTFVPPGVGASYADPVFGTVIKRSSDAPNMPNNFTGSGMLAWVTTEYSTVNPFNRNGSRLILQHQGYYGLYDGNGTYLQDLPFAVNAATGPRWSRTDANVLYYVKWVSPTSQNRLMRLDVSTGTSSLVHFFNEYAIISGEGESDISRDGDHLVLAGDNRYVFVYEISTDTKGPVLDTDLGCVYPGYQPPCFNNLYIAPNNSVAIGWLPAGAGRFKGVELFGSDMVFQRQLTHAIGHQHLARDTNGDDLLVWNNSGDPAPPIFCPNGIVKVRLSDAHQTCLLPLDWSLAVHITASDGNGWVFVETYDPADPPASLPAWKLYTNEILKVKLDGTGETQRLLHHRSRQTANYEYQPRATVSRDGRKLVYTSNYGLQAILGYPTWYTDVYFVAVPPIEDIIFSDGFE